MLGQVIYTGARINAHTEAPEMTTDEAAELLGLSRRQVQHLIKTGVMQAEKRGRDYWITPAAVAAARNRPPIGRPEGRPQRTKK